MALGWIGYGPAGTVEECDGERIETEFWCAVIPLRPVASYYLARDAEGEPCTIPLVLHRRSVIAGYLRTSVAMAALVVSSPVVLAPDRWFGLWPLALALTAMAAWLILGYGRLDTDERARRALLRRVVGVGAPPELLPEASRDTIRAALVARWEPRATPWLDAIKAGMSDELLVALAEYHGLTAHADLARHNLTRSPDDDPVLN